MMSITSVLLICVIISTPTLNTATPTDAPVFLTELGALKGKYMTVKGTTTIVHSYLGVPFAKPPVGTLRFAPPQPLEGWEGVRDATKMPPMCLQDKQLTMDMLSKIPLIFEFPEVSEDCLYLNIYTPAQPNEDAKMPVMVWIHGGGLTMGFASMYDGSVLAASQNVVVVVIQYRLGLLGFVSTGDEHAPGNYGMLDQVAALQWVQEHIHSFGGNPAMVTIFGQAAGGMSVSLLVLSPMSPGLFHRAIAQSGTALMSTMSHNPVPIAQHVANVSGCDATTKQKIVECLKQLSTDDILAITRVNTFLSFWVTKDGTFLPKSVEELLEGQEFHKVPLMTGVTDDECGWSLFSLFAPPGWADGMDWQHIIHVLAVIYPDPSSQWIRELVANEYIGKHGMYYNRIKIRDAGREVMSDLMFNIPARMLAKKHKEGGAPVYLYEFQHPPSMLQAKRASFVRTDHGDELPFVFGSCFASGPTEVDVLFMEEENKLCDTMMAYWANFARTGSPNGPGLTHWPEFGDEAEYLGIGLQQQPGKNLRGEHFTFMTQTLPEMVLLHQGRRQHTEL